MLQTHAATGSVDQKSDDTLLSEYYSQFKDQKDDKKYSLIPKFYSKVMPSFCVCHRLFKHGSLNSQS